MTTIVASSVFAVVTWVAWKLSRWFALWLFDNVRLGWAAPWVFGWAIWSWPRKLKRKP